MLHRMVSDGDALMFRIDFHHSNNGNIHEASRILYRMYIETTYI